jgi:tyrosyl-DNA phosphodiesterase 2
MQMSKLPVGSFERHSVRRRELWTADVNIGGVTVVLATTHLASPVGDMCSFDQVAQAKESLVILKRSPNVIFGGDMNWIELRRGEPGWTYDTKANAMLSAKRKMQGRLDRFVCSSGGARCWTVGIHKKSKCKKTRWKFRN